MGVTTLHRVGPTVNKLSAALVLPVAACGVVVAVRLVSSRYVMPLPWFDVFIGVGLVSVLLGNIILGRTSPRTGKLLVRIIAYDVLMPVAVFGAALMVEAMAGLLQN